MSEEVRQVLLKVMLPSLVIAVGYLLFYVQPTAKSLKAARSKLEKAKKGGSNLGALRSKSNELRKLPKTVEALKAKHKSLKNSVRKMSGSTSALERTRTIEAVAQVFKDNQLSLIQSGNVEKQSLPKNIEWLTKQRDPLQKGESKVLWQFEFFGRYLDAVKALEAVSKGPYQVVPVALNFDSKQASGVYQRWTIVIWV